VPSEVEDADHPGVAVDARGELRLALEARQVGVLQQVGEDRLQRDRLVARLVPGAEHRAHAAAAQEPRDAPATGDPLALAQRGRVGRVSGVGRVHAVEYGSAMAKRKQRAKNHNRVTQGRGWELISSKPRLGGSTGRLESDPPGEQKITVRVERRPGGKVVTVAQGFRLVEADIKKLAKTLKAACAAGGTATEVAVEVQGEHREKVCALLEAAGYQVK